MRFRPNFSTEGSSQRERTPYADMEEMQTLEPKYDELAKVQGWRLHVLVEAGYPIELAEAMAADGEVDLHDAVELLGSGCSPDIAARILL